MWVAPNLLTFVGWLLLMANFWLLAYYDWDYNTSTNDRNLQRQPIPSAVWIFCGVSHFLSYMLDGMDGKQARRTSSSTPLGKFSYFYKPIMKKVNLFLLSWKGAHNLFPIM